jgi:hypothetical protein
MGKQKIHTKVLENEHLSDLKGDGRLKFRMYFRKIRSENGNNGLSHVQWSGSFD